MKKKSILNYFTEISLTATCSYNRVFYSNHNLYKIIGFRAPCSCTIKNILIFFNVLQIYISSVGAESQLILYDESHYIMLRATGIGNEVQLIN